MISRYYLFGALSGSAWGGIAYLFGHQGLGTNIWAGIIASPLIGVIIARIYLPAYKFPIGARVFVALATLYLAATLFGMAAEGYDVARGIPFGDGETVLATWWFLTLGNASYLWPLSYFNHWLLRRLGRVS